MPALLPSELPIVTQVRHHWVVLFRLPRSIILGIALLLFAVAAYLQPWPMAPLFALVFTAFALWRWREWQAETITVTQRRIIRTRGLPETTRTESSLRLDRISGLVLQQSLIGKLLKYGTVDMEAPGNHPDFRRVAKIGNADEFYLQLRVVIFGEEHAPDPDDDPEGFGTAPIPRIRPALIRRHR